MGIVFNPMIGSFDFIREYLTKTGTVLSPIATGDTLAIYLAGATVSTDGLVLENTTASTAGATVQYSPRIRLKGHAWDTNDATDRASEWVIETKPVSGDTVASLLSFSAYTDGSLATNISFGSGGAIMCSNIVSNDGYVYGTIYPGSPVNSVTIQRSFNDVFATLLINNVDAASTGNILTGQWQSVDRFWFTREGYLKIESAMNLTTTSTDGLVLANTSPALVGTTVQYSPRLRFRGTAWDTDDAVSRTTDWIIENVPASGNTVSSTLYFRHSLDGGGYTNTISIISDGKMTVPGRLTCSDGINIANGYGVQNINGASLGQIKFGNYIEISGDVASTYAPLTVNNKNASSTGNICNFQWQTVNRFIVFKEGGIQSNYNSAIAMGTAPDNSAVLTVGWNNSTMAAGTTAARHMIIGGNITELAGAAITDIVGLYINTYTITAGAGAAVGFTAGLYIPNAPTVGTTPTIGNYALFVDAGEVRIDGEIGDTTNRVLKGWFTDLTITNSISAGGLTLPDAGLITSSFGDYFTLRTGAATAEALISRNTADAYAVLQLNNLNASSTGNLLELQWQSDTRTIFSKTGNLGIGIAPSQAIDIYSGAIRSSFGTPGACTATLKDATPGDIDNGDHIYKIVFVNALGQTIGGTESNTVTVTDKTTAGQIDLTSIPISHDLACTARKVYRTKAGGSDYFLVDTIANNTATTYTDNTADASLVTAMNTVGTDSGVFFAGTTEWGRINSTASQFKYTCDIATAADKAVILGDGVTEGDWRMIRDGNNLVMQRLESSTWTTKQTVSA
jgi:hypothetical protein